MFLCLDFGDIAVFNQEGSCARNELVSFRPNLLGPCKAVAGSGGCKKTVMKKYCLESGANIMSDIALL